MCHNHHDPHPPLHNTSRHLIVFYIFLSIHILYISPCTHQTDNIIMSILRKQLEPVTQGKEMKDKANTLQQCGFKAAMVNMLNRGFFENEGSVMRLQGLGTRRRPCASRLSTQCRSTLPAGRSASSLLGALEEATTEKNAPLRGVADDYLCLESIHSDEYVHFIAITDSV